MTARLADLVFRFRYACCAFIAAGFFALAPSFNFTEIDNDLSMWISEDDPVYQTYEGFRKEFGGQRTLLIALKSDRLFTPEGLEFIRAVTADIARVDTVEQVQSLVFELIFVPASRASCGGGSTSSSQPTS